MMHKIISDQILSVNSDVPGLQSWLSDINRLVRYLKSQDPSNPNLNNIDVEAIGDRMRFAQTQLDNEQKKTVRKLLNALISE